MSDNSTDRLMPWCARIAKKYGLTLVGSATGGFTLTRPGGLVHFADADTLVAYIKTLVTRRAQPP